MNRASRDLMRRHRGCLTGWGASVCDECPYDSEGDTWELVPPDGAVVVERNRPNRRNADPARKRRRRMARESRRRNR
jgi:hypothetical protein